MPPPLRMPVSDVSMSDVGAPELAEPEARDPVKKGIGRPLNFEIVMPTFTNPYVSTQTPACSQPVQLWCFFPLYYTRRILAGESIIDL